MTRFYIIALSMTLTIVFLVLILPLQTKVISVSSSSFSDYQRLNTNTNFQCSCSHLSIRYSTYLSLMPPSFHEVCFSDFVPEKWISLLFSSNIDQYISDASTHETPPYYRIVQYPSGDFRSIGTYLFRLLSGLCQLTNSTVIGALEGLPTQYLVNTFLFSEYNFNKQIISLFDQLKRTTATSFVANLRLIRSYMHSNALFTVTASNWQFLPNNIIQGSLARTKPVVYGTPTVNCSCGLNPLCVQPAQIGDNTTLPALMIGCFPLEAFLQSTLEILYNQTLVDFISNSSNATFTALTRMSRYQANITTVESMLSQLMVEQWETATNLISYENYYTECSPSSCTYTYTARQDFFVSFTCLLGFAGGLSVAMKIVMPFLIKVIQLIKQRRLQMRIDAQ